MNCKPKWFMTFTIDDERGLAGKYHIATRGCGCCGDSETLTPLAYKQLIEECIEELEIIKNGIDYEL